MADINRNDLLRLLEAGGPIPAKFRVRDASTAEFTAANPVLEEGEQVGDPATGETWLGDGTTPFLDLPRPHPRKSDLPVNVLDYGAKGDGATDDSAAIRAAATAAAGGRLHFPARTYVFSGAAVDLASHTQVDGYGATIRISGTLSDLRVFSAYGVENARSALVADAPAGSSSLTVANPGDFSPGDHVAVESPTIVYGTDGRSREIHEVVSVAGSVLTLSGLLRFSYLAVDAETNRIAPASSVSVSGLTFTNTDPLTNIGYAIRAQWCRNVTITDVTLSNTGGGVMLHDVMGALVDRLVVDRLPNYHNHLGYGLSAAGDTHNVVVNGLVGRSCRHMFTTLASQRLGFAWGGPHSIAINGGSGEADSNSFAVWDTHPYGELVEFNNCIARGGAGNTGASGFQIRATRVTLNNPVSIRAGLRGISVTTDAVDTVIVGGEVGHASESGVSLSGVRPVVSGLKVHRSTGAGVVLGVTAVNPRVTGCVITENGTYGIHDQGATTPQIVGCVIPQSASQTAAIRSLGATGTAAANVLAGYGATTLSGFSTPNAAARLVGNVTDGQTVTRDIHHFAGGAVVGAEFRHYGTTVGFYGITPKVKQTVTGSRTDGTALTSLLAALNTLGIVTNSSTA